jgi:hypothetical protein
MSFRLLGLVFGLGVVGLALLFFLVPVGPRIDAQVCARITPGMTVSEAHAAIGVPPGNYTASMFTLMERSVDIPYSVAGATSRDKWEGADGIILVFYDANGKVIEARFWPN